jgi:hypothetical protein
MICLEHCGPRLADTIRAAFTVWIRDDIRSTECSVQHDVAGSYIVDESIVMSLQCLLYVVYSTTGLHIRKYSPQVEGVRVPI